MITTAKAQKLLFSGNFPILMLGVDESGTTAIKKRKALDPGLFKKLLYDSFQILGLGIGGIRICRQNVILARTSNGMNHAEATAHFHLLNTARIISLSFV